MLKPNHSEATLRVAEFDLNYGVPPAAARFALVDRGAARQGLREAALELVLATGERLRISAGVDRDTLRTVLEALRP